MRVIPARLAVVLAVVGVLLAAGLWRAGAVEAAPLPTAATQAGPTLRVGIKPLDPFVTRSGSRYSGFSIELWDEIARRNGWRTEYVWHETLPTLLDDVAGRKVDVGIAGISITQEREARFDFSYPMFNAGLQVLTPAQANASVLGALGRLFSASLGMYLAALGLAIFLAGNVVWLFHRHEPYLPGVANGMFRAAAIGLVGEVGEPAHPISRGVAVVWIVLGIGFVSMFTATVTTELTVQQIQGSIRGVSDLVDRRVVTVEGSTAARYLTDRRIDFEGMPAVEAAFERLDAGTADAMVFDAPVLQHHLQVTDTDRLVLVGNVFQREDYGIAMPTGSTLRKPINETLLEMRSDGAYTRIYEHYFGRTQ